MYTDARTAHAAYRQGQVSSAGPLRIIVLLYEAAIQACRAGTERFDEPRERGESLGRAHSIVAELLAALDHEKGGEIAANLDALYRFALDSITRANTEGDRDAIRPVIRILETLLSGWREIENRRDLELPGP
jgi:flagellar protein FliS